MPMYSSRWSDLAASPPHSRGSAAAAIVWDAIVGHRKEVNALNQMIVGTDGAVDVTASTGIIDHTTPKNGIR